MKLSLLLLLLAGEGSTKNQYASQNVLVGVAGERLIQYATENLVAEVLIHPQVNTLQQCLKNLLSSFTKHRHIIHAGYAFSGTGSWMLQVGLWFIHSFCIAIFL